jgi:hypothetical protein
MGLTAIWPQNRIVVRAMGLGAHVIEIPTVFFCFFLPFVAFYVHLAGGAAAPGREGDSL